MQAACLVKPGSLQRWLTAIALMQRESRFLLLHLLVSVLEATVPAIPLFVSRPLPPLPSALQACLLLMAQAKNLARSVSSRVVLSSNISSVPATDGVLLLPKPSPLLAGELDCLLHRGRFFGRPSMRPLRGAARGPISFHLLAQLHHPRFPLPLSPSSSSLLVPCFTPLSPLTSPSTPPLPQSRHDTAIPTAFVP